MKSWVREKRTYCGQKYMELDLFEMTDFKERGRKEKKEKFSTKCLFTGFTGGERKNKGSEKPV